MKTHLEIDDIVRIKNSDGRFDSERYKIISINENYCEASQLLEGGFAAKPRSYDRDCLFKILNYKVAVFPTSKSRFSSLIFTEDSEGNILTVKGYNGCNFRTDGSARFAARKHIREDLGGEVD